MKTRIILESPSAADLEFGHRVLSALSPIPLEQWREFSKIFQIGVVNKKELMLSVGEKTDLVGLVVNGLFRVYYTRLDGALFIRRFYTEGSPTGDYAGVLSGTVSQVDVEAIEPSRVLVTTYGQFAAFYERHKCWDRFGRKLAEAIYMLKERREYQLLVLDAATRYELFLKEFPQLRNRVTQADIAAYIGVTPVSLSRLLSRRVRREHGEISSLDVSPN